MKLLRTLCAFVIVCSLALAPAAVGQGKSEENKPATTPNGATNGSPYDLPGAEPKGKAHGVRCKGLSKKHVKGQKGTPFSQCVKAMAQLAKKKNAPTAQEACKSQAKKKRKGQKKTDYARCVSAGKGLLADKKAGKPV
jgi:hypothetical protein